MTMFSPRLFASRMFVGRLVVSCLRLAGRDDGGGVEGACWMGE